MLTLDVDSIIIESNVRNEVGDVSSLAASIDRIGMLQPILVAEVDAKDPTEGYVLVAGARRLAAIKQLGWKQAEVNLSIEMGNAQELITAQYAENHERKDLTDWEIAQVAWDLKLEGLKQDEVATSMGVPKADVSKLHKIVKTLTLDDTLDDATAARFDFEGLLELTESPIPEHTQDVMTRIINGDDRWAGTAIRTVEAEYATIAFYEENAEQLNEWTEVGVQVTHELPRHHWGKSNAYGKKDDPKVTTLENLGITVSKHIKLDCHMVYINDKWGVPNFEHYCMDRKTHADKGASKVKAKHQDVAGVPLTGTDPKAAAERKAIKEAKDLRRRQADKWMSKPMRKAELYQLLLHSSLNRDGFGEDTIRAATWMLGLNDERPKGADYAWYQRRLDAYLDERFDGGPDDDKRREWKVRMMHARKYIDNQWPLDLVKEQMILMEVTDE